MFYTYILQSQQNSSYYVGSCENVQRRLDIHNDGQVRSTKRYIPWKLTWKEEHITRTSARQRELQIKSWKKRSAIENLIKHCKIN